MARYVWKVSVTSTDGPYRRILRRDEPRVQTLESSIGHENIHTFLLLATTWTSLIGDSPLELKPYRVINKFLNTFLEDPLGTIAFYSDLAHGLERSLVATGENTDISVSMHNDFSRTPIFKEYESFVCAHDPIMLRYILSFCNFGKKVAYVNSQLDAVALRQWHQVEDRLASLEIPPWVANLRLVVDLITDGWDSNDFTFLPKHGSGSVAEPGVRGTEAKNEAFTLSPTLRYMYFKRNIWDIDRDYEPGPLLSITDSRESCKMSRLLFVPKTWKTSRSICMEPLAYQWAQQGVRIWYEKKLSEGILGRHVVLKDQGENQRMAMIGSRDQNIDTIDLSSASDSVAWALIKSVFKPSVLKHLAATRTSRILLPDGTVHSASKYAPMGSALCFPVQSTLYSAIVAMVSIAYDYSLDWRDPLSFSQIDVRQAWDYSMHDGQKIWKDGRRLAPFRCYGDDITCDKRVTSNVIEALELLGFSVNIDKSFVGNATYRESCGKSYHRGEDVTPLRFKTDSLTEEITCDALAGIIEMANRAYDYGYVNLRKHVIQYALYTPIKGVRREARSTKNAILFVNEDNVDASMAIRCVEPRNTHLRRREADFTGKSGTNSRWQRSEYRSLTVGPKAKVRLSGKFDNYHLGLWWRSRYHESDMTQKWVYITTGEDSLRVAPHGYESDENPGSTIMTDDVFHTGAKWRWTATWE